MVGSRGSCDSVVVLFLFVVLSVDRSRFIGRSVGWGVCLWSVLVLFTVFYSAVYGYFF